MPHKNDPNELTQRETNLILFIIANPQYQSLQAAATAFGIPKGTQSKLLSRARFKKALAAEQAKKTAKVVDRTVDELCSFDALQELADMAASWRGSEDGPQMCHVKAAEIYLHAKNGTPEAKKIMVEIQNRANGGFLGPQDDFKPDWAKRVN